MKGSSEHIQISMGMTALTQKKIEKDKFERIMTDHLLLLEDHSQGKRTEIAIKKAIESPMCEATIKGATEVIFLVRGNVMIKDTEVVRDYIIDLVGYDVQVLYSIMVDESMGDTLSVTLIAMGMKA
ncbi:MAG: hypothetical protein K6A90_11860 [Lachnospiraceae bacterium]|nr:hypothetical protein [Lachnospiraceae bacterium]